MRPARAAALPRQPPTEVRCRFSPAAATERQLWQLNLTLQGNVANLWVNQRSQINEDTVKHSLAAQDINPIAYAPDLIFAHRAGFVPGSVQLIGQSAYLA